MTRSPGPETVLGPVLGPVLGAVLAGGAARRFGSDKALAELDGRTLLDTMIATVAARTADVVVCGRSGGLPDRPAPGLGPLGGLNAALCDARARGFAAVLAVPCDAPLLTPEALDPLFAAGPSCYLQGSPVIGLWDSSLADALDLHMRGEDRSMRGWARACGAAPIAAAAASIANVNTRDDLARIAAERD